MIRVNAAQYCSDICRQRHRGKTTQEKQQGRRKARRSALWNGLPLFLLGSVLLLVPLVVLLAILFTGHFRLIDLLGVVYFIPGGSILFIGIYKYKEHAPRRSTQ